jgi:hypothetical protein
MGFPIARGAILTIEVDIRQISVKDPVDTLIWTGKPENTS